MPVEIKVPSARMLLSSNEGNDYRSLDLEILEGKREQVQKKVQVYQRKIAQAYNKLVKPRIFQEGDLVLKAADHAMKGLHAPKFTPKWEGPYEMVKDKPFRYCIMKDLNTDKVFPPTNLKFVKKYYI